MVLISFQNQYIIEPKEGKLKLELYPFFLSLNLIVSFFEAFR